jgi:hypothetical protein
VGLIEYHVVKSYGGNGGIAPPFLASALDGGEWSCPCYFATGETATGIPCTGGYVDFRACLDV